MWEIKISDSQFRLGCDVTIFEREGNKIRVLGSDGVVSDIEMGGESKPTLYLESGMMKSLADALDQHGIKTDSDAKMKGTLDATRFHLEDLRLLLKLKK